MRTSIRYSFLMLIFILSMSIEHAISLPFLSFTFAIFLFSFLPYRWRNITFVVGGIVLATLYIMPFWLSLLIFFCLRIPTEFLTVDRRYQDSIVVLSIFLSTAITGWWIHYPLVPTNILLITLSSLILGLIMLYFVRQRQPRQRLRTPHGN